MAEHTRQHRAFVARPRPGVREEIVNYWDGGASDQGMHSNFEGMVWMIATGPRGTTGRLNGAESAAAARHGLAGARIAVAGHGRAIAAALDAKRWCAAR